MAAKSCLPVQPGGPVAPRCLGVLGVQWLRGWDGRGVRQPRGLAVSGVWQRRVPGSPWESGSPGVWLSRGSSGSGGPTALGARQPRGPAVPGVWQPQVPGRPWESGSSRSRLSLGSGSPRCATAPGSG